MVYLVLMKCYAELVCHMGTDPQSSRRGHLLRGSGFLRRLVEQCILGPVRSRLEPTGLSPTFLSLKYYKANTNKVHNFLLRHVYHSSISSMRVNKQTATLITFFLSACVRT